MPRTYLSAAEERALVIKAQAGDMEALTPVLDNMRAMLYSAANSIAANHQPADPDDLVQEGIFRIVSNLHNFDVKLGYRFATYFLPAARNAMLYFARGNGVLRCTNAKPGQKKLREKTRESQIKHSGALMSLNSEIGPFGMTMLDTLPDHRHAQADQDAELHDVIDAVAQCVERIPDRYRGVIRMKFLEQMTYEEIGAVLGVTRERVRQIILEAMRWVKRIFLSDMTIREFVRDYGDDATAANCKMPRKKRRW